MVLGLENDDFNIGFTICANCGDFILKHLSYCPSCNSAVVKRIIKSETSHPNDPPDKASLFICSACGAFIGVDATHCKACGAKRVPLTAEIDVNLKDQTESHEAFESSHEIYLCGSCGAFLGSQADCCGVCGEKVSEDTRSDKILEEGLDHEAGDHTSAKMTHSFDVQPPESNLFLCGSCGAFVSYGSMECGICGAETSDITDPRKVQIDKSELTEGLLSSSKALSVCHTCGAFIAMNMSECKICGTEIRKNEYEQKIPADIQVKSPPKEEIKGVFEKMNKNIPKIAKEKISKISKKEVIKKCRRLYYKKAVALRKLGRNKDALKSLNDALNLDPDDKLMLLEKADVFYEIGRYKQAAKIYTRLLASNPNDASLWNKLGNVSLRMGNQRESQIFSEKALSIDANNKEALINKGYILMKQKKYEEALEYAEKLIA